MNSSKFCIFKYKAIGLTIFLLIVLSIVASQLILKQKNEFVVLLTMTIDTKNTIIVSRNKIADRIGDYRKSLMRWAELPYKVVVVENSGYGNPFQDILKNAPNIQYVSTFIPSEPKRGKGYGEAQTLQYAIDNIIKNDKVYIMKVTGRYAPAGDLSEVLKILKEKKPEVLYKPKHSEWFVAKRPFYMELCKDCLETCNDSKGSNWIFEAHLENLAKSKPGTISTDLKIKVIKTRTGGFNQVISEI